MKQASEYNKKETTHGYREQTPGYQWGEGGIEEQDSGRGLRGPNCYV